LAFSILFSKQLFDRDAESKQHLTWLLSDSHLLLGGILAIAFIRLKMHVFLPDTALAKSEGVADWNVAFFLSIRILISSLSFGIGMFFFWILTIFLLLRARRFAISTFLANLAFPVLFCLAALRGQQIQGARYFVWAFFFSILWNILELSAAPLHQRVQTQRNTLVYCFLALLLLALPFESKMLYPMLTDRARLLKQFEGDHLELLQGKRGVAFDIGYIGYFSRADICDVAGLVNGRDKARQSGAQRFISCVTSNPDFIFLNQEGLYYLGHVLPLADWQVCSRYDFRNVNQDDRHYLIVPRSTAPELCKRIANSAPSEATALFP
jgi:hypothetical protein